MEYISEFNQEELLKIQNEFKRLEGIHYLDHGGTTQYADSQIKRIFSNLATNVYCNPHTSKSTEDLIDQVRYKILESFNTNTDNYSVIFTSGTTASLKLLAETFNFVDENDGGFLYLRDIHTSVLGMREIIKTRNVICMERNDFVSGRFFKSIRNQSNGRNLLIYPAQCNFNGYKHSLETVNKVHKHDPNTFVCLDAASFVATNSLDLTEYPADFVCLSFYKMFGYPTGLGALIVSKQAEHTLEKKYYGGGTVKIALSNESGWHRKRDSLHERMEDGSTPFLSIISLLSGYETIQSLIPSKSIQGSMQRISRHCFNLSRYLFDTLNIMKYPNGRPVVKLYHDSDFSSMDRQAGVINFNILHDDGSYIGFTEANCMANIHNITIRTGCFCNPGTCQRQLGLSNEEVKKHFQAGHVCGDENDLINGTPTGSLRVSVGYMTCKENVDALVNMIRECYLKSSPLKRIKLEQARKKHDPETILLSITEASNLIIEKHEPKQIETNFTADEGNPLGKSAVLYQTPNCVQVKLRQICVFPIKSCGAFRIMSQWQLTRRGLKYDREWMIVQSNGTVMTQKTDTKLCLIRPIIKETENVLELQFPYVDPVQVPLTVDMRDNKTLSSMCQTKVCGDRVDGIDCGDKVAQWLEDVLCTQGLRLIRQNVNDKRTAKKKSSKDASTELQAISLSNQAQFLLINMTSVNWLADKVEDWDDLKVYDAEKFTNMIDRFRGNLIVETPEALEELDWKYVQIGDVLFKVDGHCTRCQMICIDQSTGEKTTEPLRTIAREFQGKLRFGIYMGREHGGHNENEVLLDCNSTITIYKYLEYDGNNANL